MDPGQHLVAAISNYTSTLKLINNTYVYFGTQSATVRQVILV